MQLWETGYVALMDLRTRLGPGRGKVMDPLLLWKGLVGDEVHVYRQALVLKDTEDGRVRVVLLGAGKGMDAKDAVVVVSINGDAVAERVRVDLPLRNGRLVLSDEQVWWQSPEGEILASEFFCTSLCQRSD